MEIIRATAIREVLDCIPIEMEIRKKENERMKLKDMLLFVENQLGNPYFGFYIAYEEEGIVGFMSLFYIPIRGMEQIQVLRIWSHPQHEAMGGFEKIIRQWKKETKAPKVTIEMDARRKNKDNMGRIRAMKRKWGFKISSIVLERRK